jgi:alpha-amylase
MMRMKRFSLCLLLTPYLAYAGWTAPGLPAFQEAGPGQFISTAHLAKGSLPLNLKLDNQCWQPAETIKLNQALSLRPCSGDAPAWRLFRAGEYQAQIDTRSGTPTLMLSIKPEASSQPQQTVAQCPKWDGKPLTVDVSSTFPEGSLVRDFYSGGTAKVEQGHITLMPAAGSDGLLLLESAAVEKPAPFSWHNATVYFVLTDRFENGNPANDSSYGRHKDGMQEIGTFCVLP